MTPSCAKVADLVEVLSDKQNADGSAKFWYGEVTDVRSDALVVNYVTRVAGDDVWLCIRSQGCEKELPTFYDFLF